MDDVKSALLGLLRGFEAQFKDVKHEYMDNLHLNRELKNMSIPAKYKGPIQQLMDDQAIVLSSRIAVVFKCQIKEILLHFANNNPDVNGYANDVVEMLTCGLVGNPEDNLTNQLMDTEVGHLSKQLELKIEEVDQDSTEVVLSPVVSSDDPQLQPSTSSHSNDEEMIPSINKLPQSVTPVPEQNTNNRPVVIEPPAHTSKKDMWKRLAIEPPTCLVKDCRKSFDFDYSRIRQDHIEKDHQKTRVWHCALCPNHYTTYTTLDRHYQNQHAYSYQCTFASCTFTSKTNIQVTKHFEERHLVSAIVNNPVDESTNRDTDDDLSEHGANSEKNVNVQSIHQGSTAVVPSPVASGRDDSNELSVVQQTSTTTRPNSIKRTCVQSRNEECNQVYVDGQAQSIASAKKAKLDSTHSNIAQNFDQSRHRCMTEHCGLYFDILDDLEQHSKLVHSHPNELAISTVEDSLCNVQNADVGKRPIVSQQSSISTEPTTAVHFVAPVGSSLESCDNGKCTDEGGHGKSSTSANNPNLDADHSDLSQSQVASQSEQTLKTNYNPTKRPQRFNINHLLKEMAIFLGHKCFQFDCEQLFPTWTELNDHMFEKHCLLPFPCPLKNCGKSFDRIAHRNSHAKQGHKKISKWHCAKCCNHDCGSVQGLLDHYTSVHFPQYQCKFANCTLTSENVSTIRDHYVREHMITCRQNACANISFVYTFLNPVQHYHYIT